MGQYIYSILLAALCAAILGALAPENESVSKFVAFAGALAVALCIVQPFIGDVGFLQYPYDNTESPPMQNSEAEAEYMARNAILALSAVSGAKTEDLTAAVVKNGDRYSISLYVKGFLTADKSELSERLGEILGADITLYDGGD